MLLHGAQRLLGQVAQPPLLHALGGGVDRGQRIAHRRSLCFAQDSVFGMDHLKARRAAPDLPEAADVHAGLKLRLLLPRKVKEAQGELAAAVTDTHQQVSPAPERDFR